MVFLLALLALLAGLVVLVRQTFAADATTTQPAAKVTKRPPQRWLEHAFLCIYRHERGRAGWATNTGNGYYGGLQMDLGFQQTYGREYLVRFGTANRWPASVQMAVGISGWIDRGFQPWPNTAKSCGLL